MNNTIPVCIFNGFLESGKTTLIQSLLEDKSVNNGNGILVLLCEEGEIELDPDRFCASEVSIETIDSDAEFTTEHLSELQKKTSSNMVMIEKHGLWPEFFIRSRLPDNWVIAREYMTIDASQLIPQNNNFRELIGESIRCSNYFIVNRMTDDRVLLIRIHRIIRALNRHSPIFFQLIDGRMFRDDTVLPLPYDINADIIVIKDDEYAEFQQDIMESPDKYNGKRVKLKGRAFEQNTYDIPGMFYFGRFIQFSSMSDIRFMPVPAVYDEFSELNEKDWYSITARIEPAKIVSSSDVLFPLLYVESIERLKDSDKPKPEVASVYDGR